MNFSEAENLQQDSAVIAELLERSAAPVDIGEVAVAKELLEASGYAERVATLRLYDRIGEAAATSMLSREGMIGLAIMQRMITRPPDGRARSAADVSRRAFYWSRQISTVVTGYSGEYESPSLHAKMLQQGLLLYWRTWTRSALDLE